MKIGNFNIQPGMLFFMLPVSLSVIIGFIIELENIVYNIGIVLTILFALIPLAAISSLVYEMIRYDRAVKKRENNNA